MITLSVACLVLVGIAGILTSSRFFKTKEFMPYHATLVGQPWSEISPSYRDLDQSCRCTCHPSWLLLLGLRLSWLRRVLPRKCKWPHPLRMYRHLAHRRLLSANAIAVVFGHRPRWRRLDRAGSAQGGKRVDSTRSLAAHAMPTLPLKRSVRRDAETAHAFCSWAT